MKIDELDESQGLTADMVREWLTKQKAVFCDGRWTHPNGKYRYTDREYGGLLWPPTLSQMAVHFDKANEQALLREINPRMRKGWPSDAALHVHLHWMVQPFDDDGFCVIWDVPTVRERRGHAPNAQLRVWPCDKHGNKVRWPTDAEGKML